MFEKHYELAVCGGGVAGVAAALAAARRGVKCALIEKTIQPGGLATGGLVLVYLPLCDGKGKQVTYGVSEELLQASIKYGPADVGKWQSVPGTRYRVFFSPAAFVLAMDELLINAGVDVWYDTVITGVERRQRRIEAVNVFNKSGHGRLFADNFVDATGDSDVAFMAELPCLSDTNAMVTWSIEYNAAAPGIRYCYGGSTGIKVVSQPLSSRSTEAGINGKLVSGFSIASRKSYLDDLKNSFSSGEADRHSRFPLALPSVVPLRHTRCIEGRTVLQPGKENSSCPDSIGLAADWRCAGKVWEIPWSTMLPEDVDNLIAAGRCSSASGDAWEITRVIPAAAMTGEVAGIAAVTAMKHNTVPGELKYSLLAEALQSGRTFPLKLAEAGLQ